MFFMTTFFFPVRHYLRVPGNQFLNKGGDLLNCVVCAFRAPPQRPPWLCSAPRVPDLKLREEEAPAKDQDQETDLPPLNARGAMIFSLPLVSKAPYSAFRYWPVWQGGYFYTTPLTIKGPSFSSFPRRVFTLFTMAALPPSPPIILLISNALHRTRTRTNTIPNGTEANAAG